MITDTESSWSAVRTARRGHAERPKSQKHGRKALAFAAVRFSLGYEALFTSSSQYSRDERKLGGPFDRGTTGPRMQ